MKKLIFIAFLSLMAFTVNAQKVKIKKGIVYVDGKECLKVGGDANNVSFSTLDGEEIIFLKFIRKYGDLYNKVVFLDQKISFTSTSYIFGKKLLIKKLLEDGTLKDCGLVADKVERFAMKFDEDVD